MKFGSVPVGDAEGSILAHSVPLPKGRLRKGMTLSADDVRQLLETGIEEVVVARLEAGDLHEDAAADTLAQALVSNPAGAFLSLSQPFTGRVNIAADRPGVVEMDVAALHALNAIHPMITLATVPPWQQVAVGNMVGTVKIISYGVPERDIDRACEIGRDSMRLRPVTRQSASLILTEIPGSKGGKGKEAVSGRLSALGMELAECIEIPHQSAALTEAVAAATGEMILILTASATSDPEDVAPAAVRQAGGQVERFGMPVDPGNLLFLGDRAGTPVIGLPGCARSPALNGADWVLSRVACDVPVSDADIAGMGVGGLLKEIPTRPMPRERKRR